VKKFSTIFPAFAGHFIKIPRFFGSGNRVAGL